MQKQCSQCNKIKDLSEFAKQKTGKLSRRADCKECVKRFRRSPHGLAVSIHRQQRAKSEKRGYAQPTYSSQELYAWMTAQANYGALYMDWVISRYDSKLCPSCDRIDDYKSYTLANIQLVTAQENVDNYNKSQKAGINNKRNIAVDQLDLDGTFIQRFYSVSEAARQVQGIPSNIIGACTQRTTTRKEPDGSIRKSVCHKAYGFKWRYSQTPHTNREIK